jgi:hypothetical protein
VNNRIAILAVPRTGSTSLYKLFQSHLDGYMCFLEPFNPQRTLYYNNQGIDFLYIDPFVQYDKVLCKTIYGGNQWPIRSFGLLEKAFTKWMSTYFDKVVVLDRRDKQAQVESLLINMDSGLDWHEPKIYDVNKIDEERLSNYINYMTQRSEAMRQVAKDKSWPVFYYEDLYVDHNMDEIKRMFDYAEIVMDEAKVYDFIISDKRRVRIDLS